MRRFYSHLFISFLLFSCGGEAAEQTETAESNIDTVSIDTLQIDTLTIEENPEKIQIDVSKLLAKAEVSFTTEDLPLSIDSAFIADYCAVPEEDDYNMTGDEAKYLSFDMCDNNPTEMIDWKVQTFIRLDSIRKNGGWDDYQESLDLGQARYSNANVIGKIQLSDQTFILLWHIQYATYEACPYAEGSYVLGTLFTKDVGINTTLLAELSGGGDPPAWGDTKVTSLVSSDQIVTESLERWGEEDYESGEEFVEEREGKVVINILATGFEEESEEQSE